MTTKETIEQKITAIKHLLNIAQQFRDYSRSDIEKNDVTRLAVERLLYLTAQATIDLADALISLRGYRKPTSFSESFEVLSENKIIDRALCEKMISMTGFRNVVAHDYIRINYDRVYEVLHHSLEDIENFTSIVESLN